MRRIHMGVLARFRDIMSSNINALLDKAEDPEKMIDQYLRNLNADLGKVKAETASIMAEETRAKRAVDEGKAEVEKMQTYAIKALEADNEADAKKFLEKKTALTADAIELQASYELASVNAEQMKQRSEEHTSELQSRGHLV